MTAQSTLRLLTIVALAAACAGCWGSSSNPKTVRVSGKVTCQGKPVTDGTVLFQPVKAAPDFPLRPATGQLGSDGSYRLSTFGAGDGAVPGDYQVGIRSIRSGPTTEDPTAPFVWGVPQKYVNPAQSGLKATIPADASGPLEMDFDLKQ